MVQNNNNLRIILSIIVFFACAFTYANESEESGYFIDRSGEQPRFIQRFVWEKEEYALRYEVVIQVFRNGYRDFVKEETDKLLIEVSLPPGRYRYNVTSYDLLGIAGDPSEWKVFEVLRAYQPVVERFTPEAFFLDQTVPRVLDIAGENFLPDSVIYLRSAFSTLIPVEVIIINNRRARLIFDDNKLLVGHYMIHVKNPGELEYNLGGFLVGYRKPMDVFVRLGLTPMIPIYGDLQDCFETKMYITGMSLGLELISSKRSTFNGGLEVGGFAYLFNSMTSLKLTLNDFYYDFFDREDGGILSGFDINICFQKRFTHRNMLTFRIGGGFSFLSGFGNNDFDEKSVHFNFCLTSLFLIFDILYAEAGVDFTHYMMGEGSGLIKPRIGLVWKF